MLKFFFAQMSLVWLYITMIVGCFAISGRVIEYALKIVTRVKVRQATIKQWNKVIVEKTDLIMQNLLLEKLVIQSLKYIYNPEAEKYILSELERIKEETEIQDKKGETNACSK